MSIATEISRLQTAKSNLKTAIEGKGVTVPSGTTLDGYAELVEAIESGGGSDNWEPIIDFTKIINIKNDTNFDSITPTTSAQQIYAAVNGVKDGDGVKIETSAADFSVYSYVGIAVEKIEYAWKGTPSASGVPSMNFSVSLSHPNLYLRDVYEMWNVSKSACFQKSDDSFQTRNQGIVLGGLSFATNNTNTATPKFSLQIGKINAQANASNFPVADMGLIDSANTNITCIWKLYRSSKKTIDSTLYNLVRGVLYG